MTKFHGTAAEAEQFLTDNCDEIFAGWIGDDNVGRTLLKDKSGKILTGRLIKFPRDARKYGDKFYEKFKFTILRHVRQTGEVDC